jgi:hypothetical protein
VIVDKKNDVVVDDSYSIALYLEEKYPNSPSLFHGGVGVHKFFQNYADHNIVVPIFKLVVVDVCKLCGPAELQDWFRKDRESKFRMTLEDFAGDVDTNIASLKKALHPIVKMLDEFNYMTGDRGKYSELNYIIILVLKSITLQLVGPTLYLLPSLSFWRLLSLNYSK